MRVVRVTRMRVQNVTCVWEPSASYYDLLSEFAAMNYDYWTWRFTTECPDHRPLVQRVTHVDCMLSAALTSFFAVIHVNGQRILPSVSDRAMNRHFHHFDHSMFGATQMLEQRFACSEQNARRATDVACRLASRILVIWLTVYVSVIRPSCNIFTMPSIHLIFMSQAYYCPWYQAAFSFATAYYCWEIIAIFFEKERRKDFHLLLIHHFATIFCLFSGNFLRSYEVGMLILLLHDVCDPFLEISKIAFYLSEDREGKLDARLVRVADASTCALLLMWVWCRLYLYPLRAIWATVRSGRTCDFAYSYWATMVLALLAVLNVMWAWMIVRALYNRIRLGLFTDETLEDPDPVALQEKRTLLSNNSHAKQN